MIEKQIFYIWLGGKKKPIANICIHNWKQKLKDYKLIEINESSPFFDFDKEYRNCKYFRNRYDKKEWAFVSDYIRCKVLYEHGGIYLDTDITIEKDFSPLLNNNLFLGYEAPNRVGMGILGVSKHHPILNNMLQIYNNKNLKNKPIIITDLINEVLKDYKGNDYIIYPCEYFYPLPYKANFSEHLITNNTYAIHWWNNSWEKKNTFIQNLFSIRNQYIENNKTKIITILGRKYKFSGNKK
ncbi:TPA: glycosyltransferase [Candidatus Avigastranaerophilus faecigallinarum]|nr:glycosyltransferase [Candidatus Avigastranaerophilus faecigallinarum]